jgi:hypothetical protein
LRSIVVCQPGRTFYLPDDRIKRTVSMLRRAQIAQAVVLLGSDTFQQRGREPRFADSRLPTEQYRLAFAALGSRPTPQ